MEKADILKYFSTTSTGFLHAVGEAGTERLLELMDCRKDKKILELGFGTGATLVKLISRHRNISVYGAERSVLMLDAARSRLKFCGLEKQADLRHLETFQGLPYNDNTFDKIVIESVLAIQERNELPLLVDEIQRILKPAGILLANETLWLPSISNDEINAINQKCKNSFGIIQSNGVYRNQSEWKSLLADSGFTVRKMEVIDGLKARKAVPASLTEFRSHIFSLLGKYKAKMNPGLKKEYCAYAEHMDTIYDKGKKYMEGVIMVAQKNPA